MSELRELYQEMILEHSKHPRNFGDLEGAECHADGHNPLCGDRVTVFVITREGRIERVGFKGAGCAISVASASMMTEALRGKTLLETEELFKEFHEMVTGKSAADAAPQHLGKLLVFSGVREFPVRVKCATLPWHTMLAALEYRNDAISTE